MDVVLRLVVAITLAWLPTAVKASDIWSNCASTPVASNFIPSTGGGSYEAIGCKYSATAFIRVSATLLPASSQPTTIVLQGGTVGVTSGFGIGLAGTSTAGVGPLGLTVKDLAFKNNAILKFTGALPPGSTVTLANNSFYLTALNGNSGMTAQIGAIVIGAASSALSLITNTVLTIANNTVSGASGASPVAAVCSLSTSVSLSDASQLVIYNNRIVALTTTEDLHVVNWPALTFGGVSASRSSIFSISGNSITNSAGYVVRCVSLESDTEDIFISATDGSKIIMNDNFITGVEATFFIVLYLNANSGKLTVTISNMSSFVCERNGFESIRTDALLMHALYWRSSGTGLAISLTAVSLLSISNNSGNRTFMSSPSIYAARIDINGQCSIAVSGSSSMLLTNNSLTNCAASSFYVLMVTATTLSATIAHRSTLVIEGNRGERLSATSSLTAVSWESVNVVTVLNASIMTLSNNSIAHSVATSGSKSYCVNWISSPSPTPSAQVAVSKGSSLFIQRNVLFNVTVKAGSAFAFLFAPYSTQTGSAYVSVSDYSAYIIESNSIDRSTAKLDVMAVSWNFPVRNISIIASNQSTLRWTRNEIKNSVANQTFAAYIARIINVTINANSSISVTDALISNTTAAAVATLVYLQASGPIILSANSTIDFLRNAPYNISNAAHCIVLSLDIYHVSLTNSSTLRIGGNVLTTSRNISTAGLIIITPFASNVVGSNITIGSGSQLIVEGNSLTVPQGNVVTRGFLLNVAVPLFLTSGAVVSIINNKATSMSSVSLISLNATTINGTSSVLNVSNNMLSLGTSALPACPQAALLIDDMKGMGGSAYFSNNTIRLLTIPSLGQSSPMCSFLQIARVSGPSVLAVISNTIYASMLPEIAVKALEVSSGSSLSINHNEIYSTNTNSVPQGSLLRIPGGLRLASYAEIEIIGNNVSTSVSSSTYTYLIMNVSSAFSWEDSSAKVLVCNNSFLGGVNSTIHRAMFQPANLSQVTFGCNSTSVRSIQTMSKSRTYTATISITVSPSTTNTHTLTRTLTLSQTLTLTPTKTTSPSSSHTVTLTKSNSLSSSLTRTITISLSLSTTQTRTGTISHSLSTTPTRSRTTNTMANLSTTVFELDVNVTKSTTRTHTLTRTLTLSQTRTLTPTKTHSPSSSHTVTLTKSNSLSSSLTRTITISLSLSTTRTRTGTISHSLSTTPTRSRTTNTMANLSTTVFELDVHVTKSLSTTMANTFLQSLTLTPTKTTSPSSTHTLTFTKSNSLSSSLTRTLTVSTSITPTSVSLVAVSTISEPTLSFANWYALTSSGSDSDLSSPLPATLYSATPATMLNSPVTSAQSDSHFTPTVSTATRPSISETLTCRDAAGEAYVSNASCTIFRTLPSDWEPSMEQLTVDGDWFASPMCASIEVPYEYWSGGLHTLGITLYAPQTKLRWPLASPIVTNAKGSTVVVENAGRQQLSTVKILGPSHRNETFLTVALTLRYTGEVTLNEIEYRLRLSSWLRCPMGGGRWVGDEISVTLLAAVRLIPVRLEEFVAVGSTIASIGAGLTVSTTNVARFSVATALRRMSRCAAIDLDDTEDESSYADYSSGALNPFAITLGGGAGRKFARGTLAMSAIYLSVGTVLMFAFTSASAYFGPQPPSVTVNRKPHSLLTSYPAALVAVMSFAVDGAAAAGTVLGLYGNNLGDIVLGWFAVILGTLFVVHIFLATVRRFPSALAPVPFSHSLEGGLGAELSGIADDIQMGPSFDGQLLSEVSSVSSGRRGSTVITFVGKKEDSTLWQWFTRPTHKWSGHSLEEGKKSAAAAEAWMTRYESYVTDAKVEWYCAQEQGVALVVCILGAVSIGELPFCIARGVLSTVLLGTQGAVMVIKRPPVHRWKWVLNSAVLTLQTVISVLSIANAVAQSSSIELAMDSLGTAVIALLLVSYGGDLLALAFESFISAKVAIIKFLNRPNRPDELNDELSTCLNTNIMSVEMPSLIPSESFIPLHQEAATVDIDLDVSVESFEDHPPNGSLPPTNLNKAQDPRTSSPRHREGLPVTRADGANQREDESDIVRAILFNFAEYEQTLRTA